MIYEHNSSVSLSNFNFVSRRTWKESRKTFGVKGIVKYFYKEKIKFRFFDILWRSMYSFKRMRIQWNVPRKIALNNVRNTIYCIFIKFFGALYNQKSPFLFNINNWLLRLSFLSIFTFHDWRSLIHSLVKTLGISMHHLIHMVELLSLTLVLKENARQSKLKTLSNNYIALWRWMHGMSRGFHFWQSQPLDPRPQYGW